jgi:hypothetical protein
MTKKKYYRVTSNHVPNPKARKFGHVAVHVAHFQNMLHMLHSSLATLKKRLPGKWPYVLYHT